MAAVLVRVNCHCENSPGSFEEGSVSAGQPPTLDQADQPQICQNW